MRQVFFVIILALMVICLPAYPQANRGVIAGQVTDTSGAVVPGTQVTATQIETNSISRTTATDTGNYTIPSLPIGTYEVRIEVQGFRPFVTKGLNVTAGSTLTVDARLEVGSISDQVTITAEAAQLQAANASISTTVSSQMVAALPLVVGGGPRSVFDLVGITPEVSADASNRQNISLGGGQRSSMGATLDGVNVMSTAGANLIRFSDMNNPPLDAIGEFKVETHGFSAEFGRAAGGKITFVSRSGTNQFRGSAFEVLRNQAFDARRFFDQARSVYKQNNFGVSAGGPVYIPKVYDGRNKTFFFGATEWFRNRVGATGTYFSTPTPEMYQGDFSNWVDSTGRKLTVYDPSTTRLAADGRTYIRDPFVNNRVPLASFSNYARSILPVVGNVAFPNVSAAPGTSAYVRNNFYNATGTTLDPYNKYSIKLDHSINDNNKFTLLYGNNFHDGPKGGPAGKPGLPPPLWSLTESSQSAQIYRATFNRVITPTIVYAAFAGKNYSRLAGAIPKDRLTPWADKYGICLKGAFDCNAGFPQITFTDYTTWGAGLDNWSDYGTYSFGNDLTVIRGKQTFKVGYLLERLNYLGGGFQQGQGLFGANRLSTSIPTNNNISTGGGNSFASFLLGEAYSGQTSSYREVNTIFRSHSMYVQDDWKITSHLTLNFGLRYEFNLPPIEVNDRQANFNPTKPNPGAGGLPGAIDFAGTGTGRIGSRTMSPAWWGGFGPRFGFAYSPDSKTVIRGGAARTFDIVRTPAGSNHTDGTSITFSPTSQDNGITSAFKADVGFPAFNRTFPITDPSVTNGSNTSWWRESPSRMPEAYDFTFSIQRQLSGSIILDTSYNSTIGAHLASSLYNVNQLPYSYIQKYGITLLNSSIDSPAAAAAGIKRPYANIDKDFGRVPSVAQSLRAFPMYSYVDIGGANGERSGHSSYHAWVSQIRKNYARGITVQGSYVFSKIIGNSDANPPTLAIDTDNPGLEKSLSQYDRTHNLKASYVVELPFGAGRPFLQTGPLAVVLGGWRISAIHTYQSGSPIQLVNSVSLPIFNNTNRSRGNPAMVPSFDGWIAQNENPNWMGSDRYFQPASFFGAQSADRFGNAPRYNGRARMAWDLNESVSLTKSVRFNESIRLEIRADVFNIANRVKFAVGNTTTTVPNVQDPNFGQVRATWNDPRQMQFGMKLFF